MRLIQNILWGIRENLWALRHHCYVCHRRMWLSKQECCSEDCFDNWLPF